MAVHRSLVASGLLAAVLAQTQPQQVNVTALDSALNVEWAIPIVDNSITSFQVQAVPQMTPTPFFLDSANTTVFNMDGTTLDTTNFEFFVGDCININTFITPVFPFCNNVTGNDPVTVANTFSQANGMLIASLRPYHGLGNTVGGVSPATGYARNGIPIARFRGADGTRDGVWTSINTFVDFSTATQPGNTHSGLMVFDFDSATPGGTGSIRPLIQIYYHHASVGSASNAIFIRTLSQLGTGYSTLTITSGLANVGSQPISLAIQRNAAERYWRFYWSSPTFQAGRWQHMNGRDVYDGQLPVGTQFNASVAWFASNEHTSLVRRIAMDRFTYSRGTAVDLFLRNLTNFEALTATTGACSLERTVTRTGLAYQATRTRFNYVLTGLLNGVNYRVTVTSVSGSGTNAFTTTSTFAPAVVFPTLSGSSSTARPALFLDARTAGVGKVFILRDGSGNGRHLVQYNPNHQPTALAVSDLNPAGMLQFPFAKNEMVQLDKDDTSLDLSTGSGISVFTIYRMGYSIPYLYSFGLISRIPYLYATNYAYAVAAQINQGSRPMSDEPGWEIWSWHAGYTPTVVTGADQGPGMRVVTNKNSGSTPMNPSYNHVGIRYAFYNTLFTSVTVPDFSTIVMYTYNYYPVPTGGFNLGGSSTITANTWMIDGCRNLNLGLATDQCWAPVLDQTTSVMQVASAFPLWTPGFGSENLYYPTAGFIRPVTNVNPFGAGAVNHQPSPSVFKLSDAGQYSASSYATKYFYGDLYGVLIYRDAIVSRADREVVQRWMGERYGYTCPIIAYPNTAVSGSNAGCADGRAVTSGGSCTVSCSGVGKTRLGGVTTAEAYICNRGLMTSKGLWCGNQCSVVTMPANAATCSLNYWNEAFNYTAGTALRTLVHYDTVPQLPIARAESIWTFSGSDLRGSLPYPQDACTGTIPDSMLAVNRPAWGELTVSPGAVTYAMDITLEDNAAAAGLAFRVNMNAGGTTNYYRVWFAAGVTGINLEFVTRTATSITTRAFGTNLQPTWRPAARVTYRVVVNTVGSVMTVRINNVLVFDTSDTAISHGGVGAVLAQGSAWFDNMQMSGACQANGNCQASEGSSCTYTCASGFVPVGDVERTCTGSSTTPTGSALRCVPPPPVPLQSQFNFNLFEDAVVGQTVGTVNVSVASSSTLDKVVLFSIISGNNETQRDITGQPVVPAAEYPEVFSIGLCSGILSLQTGGALNALQRNTFNLMIQATLVVDQSVFVRIPVTVTIRNARNRPVFYDGQDIARLITRSVDENAMPGRLVGSPITAVSVEPGQVVSYAIVSGNSMGFFAINNATGQLSVAKAGLDFEGSTKPSAVPSSFDLFVQAFDRAFPTLQSTVQVTVNVVDVNDHPAVPLQQFDIIEDRIFNATVLDEKGEPGPNIIGTIQGYSDDDLGDTVRFQIQNARNVENATEPVASYFNLNATTGVLTLVRPIWQPAIVNRKYNITDGRARREFYILNCTATDSLTKTNAAGGVDGAKVTTFEIRVYVTVNTSYTANPIINNVIIGGSRTTLDTAGGDSLTITGEGFEGVPPLVGGSRTVVAYLSATANPPRSPARQHVINTCTIVDDITITCASVGPGYGSDLAVVVTWGSGGVTRTMATKSGNPIYVSYTAPTIVSVAVDNTRAPVPANTNAFSTEGIQNMLVTVRNTGPAVGTPIVVQYLSDDGGITYSYSASYVSHTASPAGGTGVIRASLVPGVGRNLQVRVSVGDQTTTIDPAVFISYAAPVISSISIAAGTNVTALDTFSTLQPAQAQRFVLTGANYGRFGTDRFEVRMWLGTPANPISMMEDGINKNWFHMSVRPVCTKNSVNDTHSVIGCNMPSGFGRGWRLTVTVGGQTSAISSQSIGYDLPNITGVSGLGVRNADTIGGAQVILRGTNLGAVSMLNATADPAVPVFTPFNILYGRPNAFGSNPPVLPFVAQNCRVPTTSVGTQISCNLAPGFGDNLVWRVTVAGVNPVVQPSVGPLFTTSYGLPVITSLSRSDVTQNFDGTSFATAGNEDVWIDGANFGPFGTSDSLGVLPGASTSVTYKLTLEEARSALNNTLGAAADGTITYTATDCRMTREHSQLRCKTAAGAGKSLDWTVVVDGLTSTQPLLGYRKPRVTNITVIDSGNLANGFTEALADSISTDGGQTLVLRGSDFGPSINCRPAPVNFTWPEISSGPISLCLGYIQSLTYGPTGFEYLVRNVHLYDSNTIFIRTLPGYGVDFKVVVKVAEQESIVSAVTFSYAKPIVTAINPPSGRTNTPANAFEITVTGQNFGLNDPTSEVSIIFGNPADGTELRTRLTTRNPVITNNNGVIEHSVSFFLPRGLLPDRAVRVLVHPRGQPSSGLAVVSNPTDVGSNSLFDYQAPEIIDVVVGTVPRERDDWLIRNGFTADQLLGQQVRQLIILGSNFGPDSPVNGDSVTRHVVFEDCFTINTGAPQGLDCDNDRVGVAGTRAAVFEWRDDRIVAYTVEPEGLIKVELSGQSWSTDLPMPVAATPVTIASAPARYKFFSPKVSNIQGGNTGFNTAGGQMVTLEVQFLDGAQTLEATVETLNKPDGEPVRTAAQIVDRTTGIVIDSPGEINQYIVTPGNNRAAAQGGTTNDAIYEVTVVLPPGEGVQRSITIIRNGVRSDSDDARISYARPTVSGFQIFSDIDGTWGPVVTAGNNVPVVMPTLGARLRVWGTNFGLCPKVVMGSTATNAWRWIVGAGANLCTGPNALTSVDSAPNNHTYLTFQGVAGQGSGHDENPSQGYQMIIIAGDQFSGSMPWRYAQPRITSITQEVRTAGGDLFEITGFNFGAVAGPMSVDVGPYRCDNVAYTPSAAGSPQTVTCIMPEGAGRGFATVFKSVQYNCINAPAGAACSATFSSATPGGFSFRYMKPHITSVYLGGTGPDISAALGADALSFTDYLAGNAPATAPAWLHVTVDATTPGKDYYAAAIAEIANVGTDLTASGYPLRIPTAGGHLLAIFGDNFGKLDATRNCLFFPWGGRDRASVDGRFACNGRNDFVGEEEIPAFAILHWSHTLILMVAPPGYGGREILPIVGEQAMPWSLPVHYEAPEITAELSPPNGNTLGNTTVTVFGENFGQQPLSSSTSAARGQLLNSYPADLEAYMTAARPPMGALRINFFRSCLSNHLDSTGVAIPEVARCDSIRADAFEHTHGAISFVTPPGIGVNRSVTVMVIDSNSTTGRSFNYTSNVQLFNYDPPFITDTTPRPILMDKDTPRFDIRLLGDNLGNPPSAAQVARNPDSEWSAEERFMSVDIAGKPCSGVSRFVQLDSRSNKTTVELRCMVDSMTVGYKNISYTVAGQSNFNTDVNKPRNTVFMACLQEFFGKEGETCEPCPEGAQCDGFDADLQEVGTDSEIDGGTHTYPRPLPGFFNLNSTDLIVQRLIDNGQLAAGSSQYAIACPELVKNRYPGRDVCVVGCEPAEACLGDNYCAEGYRSLPPQFRCSFCDIGFYKRNNECVKCPNSPYALVIGFVLLVGFGAAAAYVLNKKKINIAFIAIFVDWAQVIAIFAASKVAWPPVVKELFHILSAFNLNIEIVAPECIVPDLQFKQKWSFIMALPLSLTVFFMLITACQVFYRAVIKGRKVTLANQGSSFASMVLLLMYVLYIYLTRNILDVFNCQPKEPDEGKFYLTVGSGEECYVAGGTQATLYPAAIVAALVYIAGYPATVGVLLWRNKELATEDQLLRAKGQGDDKLSNPRAYVLRKRFSRVYYQFKPDCTFWVLAILLRKFCLAATYILFNRNSTFQLAAALLVLFVAYAAQMKYAPYMGPGDFEAVLKSYEQKALAGDARAAQLWSRLKNVESRGRKKVYKNLMSSSGKIDASALLGLLRGWLFAYNTVEEILLFSAGTVALMGIMYASLSSKSSNYTDARDSVTWVIVGAIILTIIYFFMVTSTEVYILYTEDQRRKYMEKRAKAKRKMGSDADDETKAKDREAMAAMGEVNVGMVNSSYNPMFEGSQSTAGLREVVAQTNDVPSVDLWRVFRQGYQELRDDLERLSKEAAEIRVRRQKMEAAAAVLESATGKKIDLPEVTDANGDKFRAGRRKQEFGPVASEDGAGSSPLNAFRRTPTGMGGASPSLKSARSLGSMRSLQKK